MVVYKEDRYQHGGKGAALFIVIENQDYYGSDLILHNRKVHFRRSAFFTTLSIILSDGKNIAKSRRYNERKNEKNTS